MKWLAWTAQALGLVVLFAAGAGGVVLLRGGLPTDAALSQDDVWSGRDSPTFPPQASLLSALDARRLPAPSELEPNIEPVSGFVENSRYAAAARSVGRVDLLIRSGSDRFIINPCTGVLISTDLVLTAFHCTQLDDPLAVAGEEPSAESGDGGRGDIVGARFVRNYLIDQGGSPRICALDPAPVSAPSGVEQSPLDFVAFRVTGCDMAEAGEDASFCPARIGGAEPAEGADLFVIHHPLGRPMHITRKDCRVTSRNEAGDLLMHSCGTLPGTSGAPIYDYETQSVVAIHVQGDRSVLRLGPNQGAAVFLSAIAGQSPEVADAIARNAAARAECARE